MGVVWGEGGDGMTNQGGPRAGAGLPEWVERLIRAVWRRIFVYGGEI